MLRRSLPVFEFLVMLPLSFDPPPHQIKNDFDAVDNGCSFVAVCVDGFNRYFSKGKFMSSDICYHF